MIQSVFSRGPGHRATAIIAMMFAFAIGEAPQSGYGMTNAGYICGIVGTVLLGLTMLWVLFVLVMMVS